MEKNSNSHNIKEKAKQQLDSIVEKKPIDNVQLPLPAKIFAVLCIVQCTISAPAAYYYINEFFEKLSKGFFEEHATTSIIIYVIFLSGMVLTIGLLITIGVNMLLNRRRISANLTNIAAIAVIISTVCDIMVAGINTVIYILLISIILLIALKSYLDPTLAKERKSNRHKRDILNKKEAIEGKLGFNEKDGKPKLNYFNLFWLFFITCIFGYIWEIIWHMTIDNPGVYEERAGFLFGPFSPIYGFGAVIITIILVKFPSKNVFVIFVLSALLGGFFEYFVSLCLEICFGIRSWDYSHLPLNIEGRTSIRFFIIWGLIGVAWMKIAIKPLIKVINKIPWKLRYTVTIIATAFMIINAVMTVTALDCWYSRNAGHAPQTPMEQFYADHFNDEFMSKRFENMKMNPSSAMRSLDI